jgi:hypothetical protein
MDIIEADHNYYRKKAFRRNEDKVYYAIRTLNPTKKAREYLNIYKLKLNPRTCT